MRGDSENAWQVVRRRRNGKRRPFLGDVIYFFVARIPERVSSLDLWKLAAPLGTLVDAYIPNKRRFNKEKFGFLRYENVRDVESLLLELKKLEIEEVRLEVNIAKSPRADWLPSIPRQDGPGVRSSQQGAGVLIRSQVRDEEGARTTKQNFEMRMPEVSYKNKVSGEDFSGYPSGNIVVLNHQCNKEMELVVNRSIVALMNTSVDLVNIKVTMADIGFKNLEVKYIGGLHILIILPSVEDVEDCIAAMLKHTQGGFASVMRWQRRKSTTIELWEGKKIDTSVNLVCNGKYYRVEVTEDITSWIPTFDEEEDFPSPPKKSETAADGGDTPAISVGVDMEEGEIREGYGMSEKVLPCLGLQGGAAEGESQEREVDRGTSMGEVNGSTTKEDEVYSSQFVGKVGPDGESCSDPIINLEVGDSCSQSLNRPGPFTMDSPKHNAVGSYPGPIGVSILDSSQSDNLEVEVCSSDPLPGGRKKQRAMARRLNLLAKQGNLLKAGGKSMIWGSLVRSFVKSGKRCNRLDRRSSPSNPLLSEDVSNVPCSIDEEVCLTKEIGDLVGVQLNGFEEQLRGIIVEEGEGDKQVPS
ncbi:hypothetical protein SSX86_011271 [Deinandra increscens subsp. villosa]|uniref:RRM domain-containing protein n=1 Tax=Deinandra increscens subsp. villosa TaxID=3103831 RepID=A0AAP0DDU4_9ASTR